MERNERNKEKKMNAGVNGLNIKVKMQNNISSIGPNSIYHQNSLGSLTSVFNAMPTPNSKKETNDAPLNLINHSNNPGSDAAGQISIGSIVGRTPITPHTPSTPMIDKDFTMPTPQLQNIVCTVNLGCKLDLKSIALHARNAEYNPKRFAAVIMRIRTPRTTALIFSSGKMVCTGAKSEDEAKLAARKFARIIQKLDFDAKFMNFKIQNMVGSCDVKFPIRLEGICLSHTQFATYEPELFPGLIYRMGKPKIVLLIFVSGKIVLTGAKVRDEIYEAFKNIYPILKTFMNTSQNPK